MATRAALLMSVSVVLAGGLAGLGGPARGDEPLSKEDLLTLLREGFGEELIVEKIEASGVGFELTVPVMVELKQAGASERVLRAILGASGEEIPPGDGAASDSVSVNDMVLIPAGMFTMGLNDGDEDFSPERQVHLDAFYIDRHEVTNAEYEKFDPGHPREQVSSCDECPVTNVTWTEAATYARRAGKRLPSEAEWEKAARGPQGYLFGYGNEYREATPQGKAPGAVRVGSRPPNGYGACDMLGNVWEWCADHWSKDYYRKSPERNPQGPPGGPGRVVRGGSYANGPEVHLATRTWRKAGYRYRSIGFRCARDARKQNDE